MNKFKWELIIKFAFLLFFLSTLLLIIASTLPWGYYDTQAMGIVDVAIAFTVCILGMVIYGKGIKLVKLRDVPADSGIGRDLAVPWHRSPAGCVAARPRLEAVHPVAYSSGGDCSLEPAGIRIVLFETNFPARIPRLGRLHYLS